MDVSDIGTFLSGAVLLPAVAVIWVFASELVVRRLPARRQEAARAWAWLLLPVLLAALVLLYPLIQTVSDSFFDKDGVGFVGLDNYGWVFSPTIAPVLLNNLVWLIALPALTLGIGLLVAALADRVRYEWLVRTVMLLPAAISFAAAAVIWRLMYTYQPAGSPQLGTLNGILNALGLPTVAFLSDPAIVTGSLIVVGVWMQTGVAMLMLSAAIKNADPETLEAARLDGAGELRAFWSITVPQLRPIILVVYTTQVIFSLKIFDIVYTMTKGAYNTDVIASRMYTELFQTQNDGHAAAIAVILLVAAIPIVALNLRNFRKEVAR